MSNKKSTNILYYYPETKTKMQQWQRVHFFNELAINKINIEVFNPLLYESLEKAHYELIKIIKNSKNHFDLFFTGVGDQLLNRDTIIELKHIGIPTTLICFDNLHAPFMHKKISPHFDLTWLTSNETEYLFKKWGAQTIFLPYAANPFYFKPSDHAEINSIGFIGTPYGTRLKKINQLASNNIPIKLYSDSFFETDNQKIKTKRTFQKKLKHALNLLSFSVGRKILYSELIHLLPTSVAENEKLINDELITLHKSVSFEKMIDLYSSFAISLGIIDVRNTYLLHNPVLKLHLRTFEIPMSGGLQLINYTDEIASYFENDKEIILYNSDEELISKAKFFMQDSQSKSRRKMKLAARKRAEADHTWMNRFKEIFKKFSL